MEHVITYLTNRCEYTADHTRKPRKRSKLKLFNMSVCVCPADDHMLPTTGEIPEGEVFLNYSIDDYILTSLIKRHPKDQKAN